MRDPGWEGERRDQAGNVFWTLNADREAGSFAPFSLRAERIRKILRISLVKIQKLLPHFFLRGNPSKQNDIARNDELHQAIMDGE